MSVVEKDDLKTFLKACYKEKILLELGSEEAQLVITEFKSNLRKHILSGEEEYCQVYNCLIFEIQ